MQQKMPDELIKKIISNVQQNKDIHTLQNLCQVSRFFNSYINEHYFAEKSLKSRLLHQLNDNSKNSNGEKKTAFLRLISYISKLNFKIVNLPATSELAKIPELQHSLMKLPPYSRLLCLFNEMQNHSSNIMKIEIARVVQIILKDLTATEVKNNIIALTALRDTYRNNYDKDTPGYKIIFSTLLFLIDHEQNGPSIYHMLPKDQNAGCCPLI